MKLSGHAPQVIIRDGQIFVRSFQEGEETRNSALIQLLSHAIASWPTSKLTRSGVTEDRLPPIDLVLSPGDKDNFPSSGGWTVTKKISDGTQNGTWLIVSASPELRDCMLNRLLSSLTLALWDGQRLAQYRIKSFSAWLP